MVARRGPLHRRKLIAYLWAAESGNFGLRAYLRKTGPFPTRFFEKSLALLRTPKELGETRFLRHGGLGLNNRLPMLSLGFRCLPEIAWPAAAHDIIKLHTPTITERVPRKNDLALEQ